MLSNMTRFVSDDSGATAIEYGLIAGLVSVAIVAAVTALGTKLTNSFNVIVNKLVLPSIIILQ